MYSYGNKLQKLLLKKINIIDYKLSVSLKLKNVKLRILTQIN